MEIDEKMTMDEIESQFDSEWVLIADPETDEQLKVLGGRVRFHSKDRGSVHRALGQLGEKHNAVLYIGEFPKDMQFML